MAKLASKVYGDALFSLACEEGKCSQYLQEVTLLRQILDENPEVSTFIGNPQITKEEKKAFFDVCFKGKFSDDLIGLLDVTVTKGRFQELDSILDYFTARVKEHERIGTAEVLVPFELKEEQKTAIEQKLLNTTEFEKMEIIYRMDPSLIGGMVIRIGDRVVDTSIRHRLDTLKGQLMQVSLT